MCLQCNISQRAGVSPLFRMENYLADYRYSSRRLLSFLITLYVRLNLSQNQFAWNVVRVCVRSGFHVRFARYETELLRDAHIACYFCGNTVYSSLNDFVHGIFDAYYDRTRTNEARDLGLIDISSEFLRLPHLPSCRRTRDNIDDILICDNLYTMRQVFHAAYECNNVAVESRGLYQCKICMNRTANVVTLPCGHVYACHECLQQSLPERGSPLPCYVCRSPILAVQTLYYA